MCVYINFISSIHPTKGIWKKSYNKNLILPRVYQDGLVLSNRTFFISSSSSYNFFYTFTSFSYVDYTLIFFWSHLNHLLCIHQKKTFFLIFFCTKEKNSLIFIWKKKLVEKSRGIEKKLNIIMSTTSPTSTLYFHLLILRLHWIWFSNWISILVKC